MSQLQNFLISVNSDPMSALPGLSLFHTANGEDFLKILNDGEIKPSLCTVFDGEFLSYFFVGRPAYKTEVVCDPSYWQLPAVFVFDELSDYSPKRMYPFDTGAYSGDKFRKIIGRIDLAEFEILPDRSNISCLIRTFFGSDLKYVEGHPRSYDSIKELVGHSVSNFVPMALSKLYNFPFNEMIDDRSRLIELQFDSAIALKRPILKGIVCCKEWLRDPSVKAKIDRFECDIKVFGILPLSTSSYYSKIYELASEIK